MKLPRQHLAYEIAAALLIVLGVAMMFLLLIAAWVPPGGIDEDEIIGIEIRERPVMVVPFRNVSC
jgi:hypothetical protein